MDVKVEMLFFFDMVVGIIKFMGIGVIGFVDVFV